MSAQAIPRWPSDPAIFLDLDGTLLDLASDPAEVTVPAQVKHLLQRLETAAGGALALISGRTVADLDRLTGDVRFPVAGVHGLERRNAAGELCEANVSRKQIDSLYQALEAVARRYPQTHLEHKGIALALHYRGCPAVESQVLEAVGDRLADLSPNLNLMRGNMVLELKPGGFDKGTAIVAFMKESPFSGRTPVFVGDDLTDEDGFRAVNALDGVSVKVGPGKTQARFRLPDVSSVLAWMNEFPKQVPE